MPSLKVACVSAHEVVFIDADQAVELDDRRDRGLAHAHGADLVEARQRAHVAVAEGPDLAGFVSL
jgi:hypothetical protein